MSEHIKSTTRLLTPEEVRIIAIHLIEKSNQSYEFINKLFNKNIQMTEDETLDLYIAHKCSSMMLTVLEDHNFNILVKFHAGYTKLGMINHFTETFVVSKDFKEIYNVTSEELECIGVTLLENKNLVEI